MEETSRNIIADRFIQSFGRRRSHGLSNAQKTSLSELYGEFGIELPKDKINPAKLFREKFDNIVLEIGFGRGEHLIANAMQNPKCGFIGCEPFENGVASALKSAKDNQLKNVRLYNGDGRYLLDSLENNTIHRCYVLFPDPWTKKRHHKRRLLSADFFEILKKKLKKNGSMVIATDCESYILNVLESLKKYPEIKISSSNLQYLCQKPACFLATRYQLKALEKGITCYYLRLYV